MILYYPMIRPKKGLIFVFLKKSYKFAFDGVFSKCRQIVTL